MKDLIGTALIWIVIGAMILGGGFASWVTIAFDAKEKTGCVIFFIGLILAALMIWGPE